MHRMRVAFRPDPHFSRVVAAAIPRRASPSVVVADGRNGIAAGFQQREGHPGRRRRAEAKHRRLVLLGRRRPAAQERGVVAREVLHRIARLPLVRTVPVASPGLKLYDVCEPYYVC